MALNPLPVFLDLADGLANAVGDVNLGTPTPAGSIVVQSSGGGPTGAGFTDGYNVEETTDSPELERAEQATITKTFEMSWAEAVIYISGLGRGTIQTDSAGNVVRILSSKIKKQRGNKAILTVVSEALSFDTPPDEFQIVPVELGVSILKHPRYLYTLWPLASDTEQEAQAKQAIIRAIQSYQESPFFPSKENLNGLVQSNIITSFQGGKMVYTKPNPAFDPAIKETPQLDVNVTPTAGQNPVNLVVSFDASGSASVQLALAAALEIIQKLWRVEDSPLLTGYQITWSSYFYRPPYLNPGSVIEDPILDGGLPDYFYSPSNPPSLTTTIFDQFGDINPQSYSYTGGVGGPVSISWLRKADEIEYQRTWFKLTRTWIGSVVGQWDAQLYSSANRPTSTADYNPYY